MTEPNDPIVTTPTFAAQALAPDGAATPDPGVAATADPAATPTAADERHVASTIENGGHGQGGTPFQNGAPGNGVPGQNSDQEK